MKLLLPLLNQFTLFMANYIRGQFIIQGISRFSTFQLSVWFKSFRPIYIILTCNINHFLEKSIKYRNTFDLTKNNLKLAKYYASFFPQNNFKVHISSLDASHCQRKKKGKLFQLLSRIRHCIDLSCILNYVKITISRKRRFV